MRAAAPSEGDLVIERARLTGNGARGALEAALAHVRTGDVAGSGEILVIPRLHAREPISALRSPGDFGARLTEQMRALRQAAAVDPAGPVVGAPALRFTSKARYAAWLVGVWLGGCGAGSACEASPWPEPAAIRHWLRREVLRDGPVLVATAARLLRQRQLAAWVARLDPAERALAAASLEQSYAVPLTADASEPLAARPAARPGQASTPKRARSNSLLDVAPYKAPARRSIAASDGTSRRLRAAWTAMTGAEPVAKALEPSLARLAHRLAVLAAHSNLGRELDPATLDRARADVAEGPVRMRRRAAPERSSEAGENPQDGGRSSAEHRPPGHRGGGQHRRALQRLSQSPRGHPSQRLPAPAGPADGASSPLGPTLSAHAAA